MNVEIGAEAALFPENEYIKGIFVAVYGNLAPLHWIKNQPKCCAIRLLNPLGDPKLSTETYIKREQIKIIRLRRAGSVAYLRTWALLGLVLPVAQSRIRFLALLQHHLSCMPSEKQNCI